MTPFDFSAPGVEAIVAVPVRDEAERVQDCLRALGQQRDRRPGILLLVNNTTDATLAAIAALAPSLPCPVRVATHDFAAEEASAGLARRLAMQLADRLAPPGLPLLTTDADGRVAPDWLACNLHHLRRGADAVFGRAVIDPVEALQIPPALHEDDARECAYAAALDEIESLIDPDLHDPWPRHTERAGASIAVARDVYRAVGGLPAAPLGEDRGFYLALRRIDARIRHAPEVGVVVSGRIVGRAKGGMADTMRRRMVRPDRYLDEALEPAMDRVARLRARAAARRAFGANGARGGFGAAWEAVSAGMVSRRVAAASLPAEMERALVMLDGLRGRALAAAD